MHLFRPTIRTAWAGLGCVGFYREFGSRRHSRESGNPDLPVEAGPHWRSGADLSRLLISKHLPCIQLVLW